MDWLEKCKKARDLRLMLFHDELTYDQYLVEMKGLLEK